MKPSMYMYKESKDFNEPPTTKQNLAHYYDDLSFYDLIHIDKREQFRGLDQSQIPFYSDLAAALTAQLYHKNYIKLDMLRSALVLCKNKLADIGYSQTNHHNVNNIAKEEDNIILVTGCQTEVIINGRVDAAIRLIDSLNKTPVIVLSGAKPGQRRYLTIQDECAHMESRIINHYIEKKPYIVKMISEHIELEDESSKTTENIEKFLAKDLFNKPTNIFIVSSNFHLPRLALALEQNLRQNNSASSEIDKNVLEKIRSNVKRIILVGGEPEENLTGVVKDVNYVKQLMFQLYEYVIDQMFIKKSKKAENIKDGDITISFILENGDILHDNYNCTISVKSDIEGDKLVIDLQKEMLSSENKSNNLKLFLNNYPTISEIFINDPVVEAAAKVRDIYPVILVMNAKSEIRLALRNLDKSKCVFK